MTVSPDNGAVIEELVFACLEADDPELVAMTGRMAAVFCR